MRVLGIESTELRGGVGLAEDGRLVRELLLEEDRTHGRLLVPLARRALDEAGWSPRDLDLVAVDRGPGSYTGIRIGLAIAKSLSLALDLPVAGLDRFDLAAAAAADLLGLFGPVLDTRRGHVAWAPFERVQPGDPARRLGDDVSSTPESLVASFHAGATLFGSGADVWRETFADLPDVRFADAALLEVRPAAVALAAVDFPPGSRHVRYEPIEADSLVPLYLRPTAAEEARGS